MNATNELTMNGNDDDLFEVWFEQGELAAIPESGTHEETSRRGSRIAVVVAAVSATALTLVMIFARLV